MAKKSMNQMKKFCIKCDCEKNKSEFHKDARRPDGLFPYCKECRIVPGVKRRSRSVEDVLSNYKVVDGCWEWQGTLLIYEFYGVACFEGKRYRAHRLSYVHHVGEIPDGKIICHHCDNPKCINPEHLYAGSHKDNTRDMYERGRQNAPKGIDRPNVKLTEDQVIKIRGDERNHKLIAIQYEIAASTVSSIKTRRTWNHI
jgi:hypothetical protein